MLRLPKVCRRCKTQSRDCRKCTGCGIVWYCSKHCQRDDWANHREACGETTKLQEEIDDIPLGPRCGYCGGWSSDIKRCAGCYDVAYCCKECQTNDWASHRAVCKREHRSEKYKGKVEMKKDEKVEMKKDEKVEMKKDEKVETEKHEKVETEEHEKVEMKKHEGKVETEEHEGKDDTVKHKENDTKPLGVCGFCGKPDCLLRCTRCKDVYYCSKDCQRKHWKTHKATGCKDQQNSSTSRNPNSIENIVWFTDPYDSSGQLNITPMNAFFLNRFHSPEVERIVARRPMGSLEKAKAIARGRFPLTNIIDDFDHVSQEHPFMFFQDVGNEMYGRALVAFMFKYHPYVYRHAIFIQDQKDAVTKVEFYIDMPFPYFIFSQIKPGNYICITAPMIHFFMDGTVGIRVDDPSHVSVIDGQLVK